MKKGIELKQHSCLGTTGVDTTSGAEMKFGLGEGIHVEGHLNEVRVGISMPFSSVHAGIKVIPNDSRCWEDAIVI